MSKKFLIPMITIATLLGIGLIVVIILVINNKLLPLGIDTTVAEWVYDIRGEKGNFIYWFFRIITEFGHYYLAIGIIVLMCVLWKFKSKGWFLAGTVAVSYGLQQLIKAIVMRDRPDSAMWWMIESSSSFPSGHSITISCLFLMLMYFVIISPKLQLWLKYVLSILCGVMIALVSFSRIIMGMHYFTDVIAGLLLGSMVAVLGMIAYKIYTDKMKLKTNNVV